MVKVWPAARASPHRRRKRRGKKSTSRSNNEMSAESIYNFEVVIPEAVKTVLTAGGVTAITIQDTSTFQKPRPRVEISYRHMGETVPKREAILPDGSRRTSCFRGELKLHAITSADDAG